MTTDCKKHETAIASLATGDAPESGSVSDHLEICTHCRGMYERLQDLKNTLADLPSTSEMEGKELRPDAAAIVDLALAQVPSASSSRTSLFMALAASLLVVIGTILVSLPGPQPAPSGTDASYTAILVEGIQNAFSSGMLDMMLVTLLGIFLGRWCRRTGRTPKGLRVLAFSTVLFALVAVYEFVTSEILVKAQPTEVHLFDVATNGTKQISLQPDWSSGPPYAGIEVSGKRGAGILTLSSKELAPARLKLDGLYLFEDSTTYIGPSLHFAYAINTSSPITLEYDVTDESRDLLAKCQVTVSHSIKPVLQELFAIKFTHRLAGLLAVLCLFICIRLHFGKSKASRQKAAVQG